MDAARTLKKKVMALTSASSCTARLLIRVDLISIRNPCPSYGCLRTVSLGGVMRHFENDHTSTTLGAVSAVALGNGKGECWLPWRNNFTRRSDVYAWPEIPFSLEGPVRSLLVCCQFTRDGPAFGRVHVWLWAPLSVSDAAQLECKVKLSGGIVHVGPVFSVLWDRERVLGEPHLTVQSYKMPLITKQSVTAREEDVAPFKVSFKVYKKK